MKAEYISHMGDDLTVVNAARVSFDKESTDVGSSGDAKLINYLAKHGHWTPFSHPQITMRYTVPIFIARQEFKHIVGFTRNEVSRRYVDDTPEFYYPDSWRNRPEGSVK
jgi:thymidylate synthase (FAD)